MKLRALLVAFVCSCVGVVSAQEASPKIPIDKDIRIGKLDNGLTYYIRYNKYPENQADFYIAQKVGSIQEEDNQRGLAHFLEHMCFNGTKNFPGNQVVSYLESIGVKFGENLNAYTSIDETVYNISNVPVTRSTVVDSCLLILHDWSNALLLEDEEIDKERGVIDQEWRSRSSAVMRIYERALPLLYPGNKYGHRLPIGIMEVVNNFKPDVLRAYYHKWYRPDLQGIIIVGDIDVDYVENKIKSMFSDIKMPANAAKREYLAVEDNAEPIVVSDKDKELTMSQITFMHKHEVIPDSLKDTPAYLVNNIVKNMTLSLLNQRLAEIGQKPDAPFMQGGYSDGTYMVSRTKGAFSMTVLPKEGFMDKAVEVLVAELNRALKYGFTQTELDRVRISIQSLYESAYANRDKRLNGGFTEEYVRHFLDNEPIPSLEDEYNFAMSVLPQIQLADVNGFLQQMANLSDSNLVILSMNPDKEGFVQPTPEYLLDLYHKAKSIDLGPYVDNVKNEPLIPELPQAGKIVKEKPGKKFGTTELTLSNGVRVILKQTDYKDNEVIMSAYSPGGTGIYPDSECFNISAFGSIIGVSGLGNFTRIELNKLLAGKQVSLSPYLTAREEGFNGSSTPKDLKTLFELIYLSFQAPKRDDDAVASLLGRMRENLLNQDAKPETAFSDSVIATLYGHHPRTRRITHELVDSISYDRILEIYKDRFSSASKFTFVFCGNFDNDSIRPYIEQYLATLPVLKNKDKVVDTKAGLVRGNITNEFTKKMETPQTSAVQVWSNSCDNTLYNAVITSVVGQALNTRYLKTVREELGAVYSMNASCGISFNSKGKTQYMLQIDAPLKPQLADTAMVVIREEIEKMAKDGVDTETLDKIKEFMLKSADEGERQNSVWMSYIKYYDRYKVDRYTDYKKIVKDITSDDVKKFVSNMVKKNNCITIIMKPEL